MVAGREFEGKDVEEAIRAASKALGAPPKEIRYELLNEGRRGVFGIGARNVRIWVDLPVGEGAARPTIQRRFEHGSSPEDRAWAAQTLRRMVELMGFDLEVRSTGGDGELGIELGGADTRYILARDGELLTALQFVLNRMARQSRPEAGRIQIECQGYRDRRDHEIVEMARAVAREVTGTGRPSSLPPLNPYERRIVHLTVREFPLLTSRSEDQGFLKRVRISLAEPKGRA